ncbi:hypothetical protein ANN_02328 [Periplaneta americana]|uniref:Uncharacterized protein n=1 Tax=Periplaneta americana TaxID=6978 RepID=A0ABQ8TVY4_PERAM|nr:hypothetical protein ANN_02328 [Periplaneta americana]
MPVKEQHAAFGNGGGNLWKVSVQQDNARPHIAPNDRTWMDAAAASGFTLELVCPPPNSPDMNVLDLGFLLEVSSEHLRRGYSSTAAIASECDEGDNAGEMSPGSSTESYPAFAHIGLSENPEKKLNQVTCPDRESNLGHLVSQPDALTVTPQENGESYTMQNCTHCILHLTYKSRRLRWAGHAARMGESRNAYRVLVGRPEGKRPLGRPRRRWEDNIKMDLREVRYDDRDWINLAQDRDQWRAYVRAAMNLRVP